MAISKEQLKELSATYPGYQVVNTNGVIWLADADVKTQDEFDRNVAGIIYRNGHPKAPRRWRTLGVKHKRF